MQTDPKASRAESAAGTPGGLPLRLTVTADDFGIGVETSRGIVEAHRAGAVDATSVMCVTGDHLERSLDLLESAPALRLGLHLTFTSRAGRPLVGTRASGFVSRDGFFRGLGEMLVRSITGRLDGGAVREEILAQAERFERLIGTGPEHLDGHHHAHQLPVVRGAVAELVEAGRLPKRVRCTTEPAWRHPVAGERVRRSIVGWLGRGARPVFAAVHATMPDGFFGVLSPEMLQLKDPWASYRQELPEAGEWEMMVHPGRHDPDLVGRDTYLGERVLELQALTALGSRIHF